MLTGLSTVATRSTPPRFGAPCASAVRGRPARPAAARPAVLWSQARRVRPEREPIGSWSRMVCPLVNAVVHHAILHDEPHALERRHVLQRIAVERDQVGALADRER